MTALLARLVGLQESRKCLARSRGPPTTTEDEQRATVGGRLAGVLTLSPAYQCRSRSGQRHQLSRAVTSADAITAAAAV